MDENKADKVQIWRWQNKTQNGWLNNLFEVQLFLEFCKYYWHFIPKYSEKSEPLSRHTKEDQIFWSKSKQQPSFENVVNVMTIALFLWHFDCGQDIVIKTDATEYECASLLPQHDKEPVLHKVAYVSKKHTPAECSYDIQANQPREEIKPRQKWIPKCEGAGHLIQLQRDHTNLQYCMT